MDSKDCGTEIGGLHAYSCSTETGTSEFLIIYELYGAQKAVNFLTEYYQVSRMRIVLSGRKTGKTCVAFYEHNKATFRKKALNRRTVIHELFHHLIEAKGLEMPIGKEEKEADAYSSGFLREIRQG